jgi:hypothetical protein
MGQVTRKVTIFTEVELAKALIEGHKEVFGEKPSLRCIINAWSQCALECGRDGKNIAQCRNYNLGNITISYKQYKAGRDYWALRCKEQLRDKDGKLTGKWKWFDMRFAANPSLFMGAVHYWTFFAAKKRKIALDAMRDGGATEFTNALAAIWYMTANPDHYLKGLRRLNKVANAASLEAFEQVAKDEDVPSTPRSQPDALPPAEPPKRPFTPPSSPTVDDIKPLLLPVPLEEEEESRPSGVVPVFEIQRTPWERFVIWLVAFLTRLLRAVMLKGG